MRRVTLTEVCRVQNGFAFEGSGFVEKGGTPLIRIRDLKTNQPSLGFAGTYDDGYVVRDGDLLIGMDGEFRAYLWHGPDALLNQRVCRLIPDVGQIDRGFLYLSLDDHLRAIELATGQTTVKHLSSRQLESIGLLLPPLDVQRRFSDRLFRQRDAVRRAQAASHDRSAHASQLRELVYRESFGAAVPLTAGRAEGLSTSGWSWHTLTQLARLETGHTPSRNRPDWWGGEVPWIALSDIRQVDGAVISETIESTNVDGIANSSARVLPADTVVMSRTASVGFVTRMGRPMATSQDFVNWVCGPKLHPEFLMHLLIRARSEIRALSSGAIHKTVYMPTLQSFRVCVPSITEQRRIADQLRQRLAVIDQMTAGVNVQLDAIDLLPAALLRQAFDDLVA